MSNELIQHFLNTLSPDNSTRVASESFLLETSIQQPSILIDSIQLLKQDNIPHHVKLIAITFVKNKIKSSWFIKQDSPQSIRNLWLPDDLKDSVKMNLIDSLFNSNDLNNLILQQLVNSVDLINHFDPAGTNWDQELSQLTYTNLTNNSKTNDELFVYKNLLLIKTITKKHRYDSSEQRPQFVDKVVEVLFPLLEQLLSANVLKPNSVYLILKIYKYTTFTFLPPYLQDLSNLNKWVNHMLNIINKYDNPNGNDEATSKCIKWSLANLYRIVSRHLRISTNKQSLVQHFIPAILQQFFPIIGNPSKMSQLSDSSKYYLVSFITESLKIDETWQNILQSSLEQIMNLLIIPMLSANEEIVELFEDDPQEYLRRYYDMNHDLKTGYQASIEFVYLLATKRFADSFGIITNSLNTIFNGKETFAYQAGLKILTNIWTQLLQVNNSQQLDDIMHYYIDCLLQVPRLSIAFRYLHECA
ncbi:unnamed protein product [Ambrosiozyma monospora]|uniref:Unnamed protein product n=1 Tax=Ambrosiozyma monospora TaxID=43982 RepID=A0A9W6YR77_AMBMO|nr:unnamed protein product [Ambrosiozyma monospora]